MPTFGLADVGIIVGALIGVCWVAQSYRYRQGYEDGKAAGLKRGRACVQSILARYGDPLAAAQRKALEGDDGRV